MLKDELESVLLALVNLVERILTCVVDLGSSSSCKLALVVDLVRRVVTLLLVAVVLLLLAFRCRVTLFGFSSIGSLTPILNTMVSPAFLSRDDIGMSLGGPVGFLALEANGDAKDMLVTTPKSLVSNKSLGSAE